MSLKKINKSLQDTLSTTILVTLALILSLRVFPMAIFLYPIAFIVLGVNYSLKNSIIGILISSIMLGFGLDLSSGIFMFLLSLPLLISLVLLIKKDFEANRVLLISTVVLFVSILVLLFASSLVFDIDIKEKADSLLTLNINNQLEVLEDLGIGKEGLVDMEETLEIVHENILVTLPSLFIIISTGITYINYALSAWILRKEKYELKHSPVFSNFKLPKSIFLGTMLMFGLSYVFNKLNILNGEGLTRNLVVLLTFIFSIQGLSVLDYLMIKRGLKRFGRTIMLILLVFVLRLGSILSFVGVLDAVIDFRKIKKVN